MNLSFGGTWVRRWLQDGFLGARKEFGKMAEVRGVSGRTSFGTAQGCHIRRLKKTKARWLQRCTAENQDLAHDRTAERSPKH